MNKFLYLLLVFSVSTSLSFAEKQFTLNFNNVDIKTFIKLVSDNTGQNYVIGQNVSGNITIFSPQPVDVDKLPQIFQAVLNLYGYTIIRGDYGVYDIVPSTEATSRGIDVNSGEITKDRYDTFFTQIIPIKNYPVDTISGILNPYRSKSGLISFDIRNNTLFVSDFGINIKNIMDIIDVVDKPAPHGKETMNIYKLENAKAEDVAKDLNEALAKKKSNTVSGARAEINTPIQPTVVSVKSTNSLIIYAEPEDYDDIVKLIKGMDVMPKQVLIEALIVEASLDKTKQIGFEWADANSIKSGTYTEFGGQNFGTLESYASSGTLPTGLSLGFYKGTLSSLSVGALLNLLANDTSFKIESAPEILAADNQEATINVSENVPYLTQSTVLSSSSTTASSGSTVNNYDYKDVGIMLKITPQISQDKYVMLKIDQEVTKIITGAGTTGTVTTAKRTVNTTLIVPNDNTIVLGGLISNENDYADQKTPGLANIPLLGWLFKQNKTENTKTNLMIFITPHIINDFQEAEKIKQEKEKLMKNEEKLIEKESTK